MSKAFPSPEHRTILLSTLKLLGASEVIVNFSGGGDSGEIQSVDVFDVNNKSVDIDSQSLEWVEARSFYDHEGSQWINDTSVATKPLSDILEQVTLNALEEQGIDWYNNDGGQGQLTIDFSTSPPTIELNVGVNYMETEEHSFDYTEETT